jgi:hypothetical protein
MRIPEPMPLGETFLDARVRAMMVALLVNSRAGGKVETVFTFCTQRFDFRGIATPGRSVDWLLAIDNFSGA